MANENKSSLNLELARYRAKAFEQLVSLTGIAADECRETYLFEDDRFCGVIWTLSNAKAVWRSDSDKIAYHQNGQPVSEASDPQASPIRRAA